MDLPSCHKCPRKNHKAKLAGANVYQPRVLVRKTLSDLIFLLYAFPKYFRFKAYVSVRFVIFFPSLLQRNRYPIDNGLVRITVKALWQTQTA